MVAFRRSGRLTSRPSVLRLSVQRLASAEGRCSEATCAKSDPLFRDFATGPRRDPQALRLADSYVQATRAYLARAYLRASRTLGRGGSNAVDSWTVPTSS
jgi:hypothetical protein